MVHGGHQDTEKARVSDTNMYLADQSSKNISISMHHCGRRTYREVVCESTSWLNWTLAHAGNTIHLRTTILVDTVEVQTRTFVAKLVESIDHNTVSHSCRDIGQRPLAVNSYNRSIEKAIRVGIHPCDVEIVYNGSCVGEPAKAENKND